jgi:seryl-tRNA(Sec) selenium transferase
MTSFDQRLLEYGYTLPTPLKPFGVYRPVVQYRVGKFLHLSLSGHGPFEVFDNKLRVGKVGVNGVTKEMGAQAAFLTALGCLSTIRNHLGGSFQRFRRVIKSLVLVNCHADFKDHIFVANGFAQVFKDVFGEDSGVGARSAIGTNSLPMNQTVEVEMIVEVELEPPAPQISCTNWWVNDIDELQPIVNCCGHFTSLGGSHLHPLALQAMIRQSQRFVDLNVLLLHGGKRIAKLVHAPQGYEVHITGGASSGISLSTVACLCRNFNNFLEIEQITSKLPDITQIKSKHVIVDGASDLRWLSQIRLTGAKVVTIGNEKNPMNEHSLKTTVHHLGGPTTIACILYFDGSSPNNGISLKQLVKVASSIERRAFPPIPVVVDAAARLPPITNLTKFVTQGASAVLFSGGKAIRGPQSSGFIIGKKWLIERARAYACPREDSVCRGMKTTKESIVGLVAALEAFVKESSSYPKRPNHLASVVQLSLDQQLLIDTKKRKTKYNNIVKTRLNTGFDENLVDVQPNGHHLLFIDILNLQYNEIEQSSSSTVVTPSPSSSLKLKLYGNGVNHSSPMLIQPKNIPTYLASRLCRVVPNLKRIAVNTTANGIFINPILLKDIDEAKYVGKRIADEINHMVAIFQQTNSKL